MHVAIPYFLKKSIIIILCLFIYLTLAPDAYSQAAPKPQNFKNCLRPATKEETHQCFVILHNQNLKRAQEKKPKVYPPTYYEQQMIAEFLQNEQRRSAEKELIRQRIEAARARNISNKGKKYRITYGRVTEPSSN